MADTGRRPYRPGDEESWLGVLQAAFPEWPKIDIQVPPINHLRWKAQALREPPIEHPMLEEDGRIIAGTILWKRRVKLRRQTLLASTSMDMSVHPDYQRREILKRSREEGWRADADFGYGYPSGHAAVAKLNTRNPGAGRPIVNAIDVLMCELDTNPPASTAPIATVEAFDERIDAFWRVASTPYDFTVVRDREYLNWRFCDPRAGSFIVRQAEESGHVAGYVVTSQRGDGRAFIADLLALPGRDDVVVALLSDALRELQKAGAEAAECWLPVHHPYRELMASLGFHHKRRTLQMSTHAIRIDSADLDFLEDPRAAVHITMGDTDLV